VGSHRDTHIAVGKVEALGALNGLERLGAGLSDGVSPAWIQSELFNNLGVVLDMLELREEAVDCVDECIEKAEGNLEEFEDCVCDCIRDVVRRMGKER